MQVVSEGPVKITKATIEAAWRRRRQNCRLILRDKDCRGLALVVNPTVMRWEYAYRPRGTDPVTGRRWPNRTVTLGNPETHSPDDARAEANRMKGQVVAGTDPAEEKKVRAEAERRKRGSTLERLVGEYSRVLPKRPKMRGGGLPSHRYIAEELAQVRLALVDMDAGSIPAIDLTSAMLKRMVDTTPGAACSRFGAISRFMDWCLDRGHISVNPCTQIARSRRPKAPQARSHYLTLPELARLWSAADVFREPVWRDLVRFLIAVPCRRNEATHLDWVNVDLSASEWRQPKHMTKNRDPHRLHLHALTIEVLHARQKATGGKGLVFPAPISGRPVATFADLKAAIVEATKSADGRNGAALDGWTWHDFRRSFATALGEAGIPETVADATLNHRQSATRSGVLGVYQRSSRWPEQVQAMELWGRLLATAINSCPNGANRLTLPTEIGRSVSAAPRS
jgi:integrase